MRAPAVIIAAVALAAFAGHAQAAPSRAWLDARSALSRCLTAESADARGACLERAARALDEAESKGGGPIPTPAERRRVEAQQYGLRIAPPLPAATVEEEAKPQRVRGLSTTIASAVQDGNGNWIMTTAEGAVWAQTDGSYLYRPPHPGSTLQVHPAALGSYFCLINDRREVRCKRRS